MSRVCSAERPNSPSKDCCRKRYGSSCLMTSAGGVDTELLSRWGRHGIVPSNNLGTAPGKRSTAPS